MLPGASPYDDYIFGGIAPDFVHVAVVSTPSYDSKWHRQAERWINRRGGAVQYTRAGEPTRTTKGYIPPTGDKGIVVGADQTVKGWLIMSVRHWQAGGFIDIQGPQRGDSFETTEYTGYVEHATPVMNEGLPVRYEIHWQGAPYSRV